MNRRQLLQHGVSTAALALVAACGFMSVAAPSPKRGRIGILTGGVAPSDSRWQTFRDALRNDGWIEGQNLTLDWRTDVDQAALARAAADLVGVPVDVIVVASTPAALAAKAASSAVPIVGASLVDPLSTGLMRDVSHPEGNITGTAGNPSGWSDAIKELELANQVVPGLTRAAILFRQDSPAGQYQVEAGRQAGESRGLQVQALGVQADGELEGAFAAARARGAQALVVVSDPLFLSTGYQRVPQLASQQRLPDFYSQPGFVEAGGLLSYGTALPWKFSRAADLVDRILRGAKVGDLPFEYPTVFELVVNSRTAGDLGLTIPHDIALQVTKWVQ